MVYPHSHGQLRTPRGSRHWKAGFGPIGMSRRRHQTLHFLHANFIGWSSIDISAHGIVYTLPTGGPARRGRSPGDRVTQTGQGYASRSGSHRGVRKGRAPSQQPGDNCSGGLQISCILAPVVELADVGVLRAADARVMVIDGWRPELCNAARPGQASVPGAALRRTLGGQILNQGFRRVYEREQEAAEQCSA